MIRVFPRRTKWTPTDELTFVGDPPLFLPPQQPVYISCTFTWDLSEAQRLHRAWSKFFNNVHIGGPAFNDPGNSFTPGLFIKPGVTFTSRGCPYSCPWCLVPAREGNIRELPIKPGHIIQDNNLLATSNQHQNKVFTMLESQHNTIFSGGLDSKLFNKHHVRILENLAIKELWFSCDTNENLHLLENVANLLPFCGGPPMPIICFSFVRSRISFQFGISRASKIAWSSTAPILNNSA